MARTRPGGAGLHATRRPVTVPRPRTCRAGPLSLPGRGQIAVADIGARDAPVIVLPHSVARTGFPTWYRCWPGPPSAIASWCSTSIGTARASHRGSWPPKTAATT